MESTNNGRDAVVCSQVAKGNHSVQRTPFLLSSGHATVVICCRGLSGIIIISGPTK